MQLRFGVIAALILIALTLRQMLMKRKEAAQSAVDGFEDKSKVIHLRPKPVKGKFIIPIVIVVVLLILVGSSVYQLHEDEYAVVTTFGVPHVVNTSGLKFKIPLIQHKTIVSKNVQGFPIGYDINTNESVEDESVMISVDFNFVNVDFYVEYRVIDPVKYLYNSQDPVGILKMLCQSYIRDTIGLYNVDDVITTGSTLKECAQILSEAGAARVSVAVAAWTAPAYAAD